MRQRGLAVLAGTQPTHNVTLCLKTNASAAGVPHIHTRPSSKEPRTLFATLCKSALHWSKARGTIGHAWGFVRRRPTQSESLGQKWRGDLRDSELYLDMDSVASIGRAAGGVLGVKQRSGTGDEETDAIVREAKQYAPLCPLFHATQTHKRAQ